MDITLLNPQSVSDFLPLLAVILNTLFVAESCIVIVTASLVSFSLFVAAGMWYNHRVTDCKNNALSATGTQTTQKRLIVIGHSASWYH
jgi:hypothetical protein